MLQKPKLRKQIKNPQHNTTQHTNVAWQEWGTMNASENTGTIEHMIRQFWKDTKIKYVNTVNLSSNGGIPVERFFCTLLSIKFISLVLEKWLAVKISYCSHRDLSSVPSTHATPALGDLTSSPEYFGHLHLCTHIYR